MLDGQTGRVFRQIGLRDGRRPVLSRSSHLWALARLRDWDKAAIFEHLKTVARVLGVKPNAVMPIVFIAIAGTTTTFSITDAMAILGPELSRARLRHALTVLGQPDEGELSEWRQQFDERWRIESFG